MNGFCLQSALEDIAVIKELDRQISDTDYHMKLLELLETREIIIQHLLGRVIQCEGVVWN